MSPSIEGILKAKSLNLAITLYFCLVASWIDTRERHGRTLDFRPACLLRIDRAMTWAVKGRGFPFPVRRVPFQFLTWRLFWCFFFKLKWESNGKDLSIRNRKGNEKVVSASEMTQSDERRANRVTQMALGWRLIDWEGGAVIGLATVDLTAPPRPPLAAPTCALRNREITIDRRGEWEGGR